MIELEQIKSELTIIMNILKKSGIDFTSTTDVSQLDSIALMEFSIEIELSFGVEFSGVEIKSSNNIEAIANAVKQKLDRDCQSLASD